MYTRLRVVGLRIYPRYSSSGSAASDSAPTADKLIKAIYNTTITKTRARATATTAVSATATATTTATATATAGAATAVPTLAEIDAKLRSCNSVALHRVLDAAKIKSDLMRQEYQRKAALFEYAIPASLSLSHRVSHCNTAMAIQPI